MKEIKFPIETGEFIDEEDERLVRSFEEEDWIPLPPEEMKREVAKAKEAARNFTIKNKRINIRLNTHDYTHLKAKAAAEGIPYQTLVAALIHKYISGELRVL